MSANYKHIIDSESLPGLQECFVGTPLIRLFLEAKEVSPTDPSKQPRIQYLNDII